MSAACPPSRHGPLLPNEPRLANAAAEAALTQAHLLPALADLDAFFRALRAGLDDALCRRLPLKDGKPYPKGQCLEISQAAQQALGRLRPEQLHGAPARGFAALTAFARAGGTLRQVWGALRETYFQNAFLVGTLYVDVANDTVNPAKPPVEILPLSDASLAPITDYAHFSRIAQSYWDVVITPNHVFPGLAPYFPLLAFYPDGSIQLHAPSDYMLALTLTQAFAPSVDALAQPPMPAERFAAVVDRLAGSVKPLPHDAASGRATALQACAHYVAQGWHDQPERRTQAVQSLLTLGPRLRAPTEG